MPPAEPSLLCLPRPTHHPPNPLTCSRTYRPSPQAIATGQAEAGPASSKRDYGWELTDCAQHLVGLLEGLLQREQVAGAHAGDGTTAAAAAGAPQQQLQQGEPEGGALGPATMEGVVGSAAEGGAAQQDDEAAQRRERARLKKERMLAKMKVGWQSLWLLSCTDWQCVGLVAELQPLTCWWPCGRGLP